MSRSLSSFEHPDATTTASGEDGGSEMDQGWTQEEAQASVKWDGKVGHKLRREEKSLFDTVGCVA